VERAATRWSIAALASLALAASCSHGSGGGFNPLNLVVPSFSEDDLRQIGMDADQAIQQQVELIYDPIVVGYLNELGQEIAGQISPQPFIYRFRIIKSKDLNAFALPGGYIYIHSETLMRVGSVDELAGVLGHEIAHVQARHFSRREAKTALPGLVARAVGMGAAVAAKQPGLAVVGEGVNVSLQIGFTREFEAEGIGLVRTEHMFFKEDRIPIVREMIMALDEQTRRKAVDRLLPFQREDFIGIFTAMDGYPVTIRLLDPPLHEFLPSYKEVLEEFTRIDALGINPARHQELGAIKARIEALHEANPMLGHRGCRLGITFPEIYEMQVRAIMEAACEVARRGVKVEPPEIMIPLTGTVAEMKATREMTVRIAERTVSEMGVTVGYSVGTMIEVPRAALIADKLAEHADFFSFGTNDLTQMTFGYSRDDIGKFLPFYLEKKLLPNDPFAVLDQEGVGEMIEIGIARGRKTRPKLKVGICGEHGGEPSSVEFCHRAGMDYVSCSPYMVPIAWLASAQARIKERASKAGKAAR